MSRLHVRPFRFAATALLTVACARGDYGAPSAPIGGVRFFASAELTGGGKDTLRVRVAARNSSRRLREIDAGGCGDALLVRVFRSGQRRAIWDSRAWRAAELAALQARRDTTPAGRPILYGGCAPVQIVRQLALRDSGGVAVIAIPVAAVLGDSLPAGHYRIETRLFGNGWRAGNLAAGEVELHPPT